MTSFDWKCQLIKKKDVNPGPDDVAEAAAAAKCRHVVRLCRAGYLGRAVRAAYQQPLLEMNERRRAALRALHPPAPPRRPRIVAPDNAPRAQIDDPEEFMRLLRSIDDGAAPGPSLLTANHLVAACESDVSRSALMAMVEDVVNNEVEMEAANLLTACISIGLPKPGAGADAVRPLAQPEVIYKLAGLYALRMIGDEGMRTMFPAFSIACCRRGRNALCMAFSTLWKPPVVAPLMWWP